MAIDEFDDTGPSPNIPQDRAFKAPVADPDPPIENRRGKLVSKPNTTNLGKDTSVDRLPSLEALERQIGSTFFKDDVQTRDQTSADLLSGSFDRIKAKSKTIAKQWSTTSSSRLTTSAANALPGQVARADNPTATPVYAGIMAAGAQAQVENLRFLKTYQMPYMKRQLALSYLRTDYARRQLGLLDQTRREIVAKLDVVKTNLAVPDAAKGTLFSKVMEETRRQAIARVASSIQDIGFQYANRFYTSTVTRKAAALRDRLSGGHGLRDLVSDTARARTQSLLRKAAVAAENERSARAHAPDNTQLAGTFRTKRRALLMAAGVQRKLISKEHGQDLGGRIIAPIADFASRYNPFNKNIFVPTMTSGGSNDFVTTMEDPVPGGGTVTAGKSPLFIAFTNWVSENRKDQDALRRILLGQSVDPDKLLHKGDPAKAALSKWKPLSKATSSSTDTSSSPAASSGGYFRKFFKSDQFKKAKTAASHAVSDALGPEDTDTTSPSAPGLRGKFNDAVSRARRDIRKALAEKENPTAIVSDTPVGKKRGFVNTAFSTPFVAGVKDTTNVLLNKVRPTKESDDTAQVTSLFDSDRVKALREKAEGAYASTKAAVDKTVADAYAAHDKKDNPSKRMRKKAKAKIAPLVEDAEAIAPSTVQNVIKAAAGLGLIVAPFAARAISKKAGAAYKEVKNRSVLSDLDAAARSIGGRIEDTANTVAASDVGQRVQNNETVKATSKKARRALRRAAIYGKKGVRYAQNSQLARTVEDHITQTQAYQDVMDVASPRTIADKILGAKRTHTLNRDLGRLKRMDYQTLGKLGIGLATGTAALSAAKYGYNFVRGRDTTQSANQLKNYFGISGLTLPKLVGQLKTTAYSGMVSDEDVRRLELGEPLHRVLSASQINSLSKMFRTQQNKARQALDNRTQAAGNWASRFVGNHTTPALGGLAGSVVSSGAYQASKVFGSLTDNINAISRAVGLQPKDNIFTRYADGINSLNKGVKEGGGLLGNLFHSVFGKDKEARSKARGAALGTVAISAGAKWLKRRLVVSNRDRAIAEGIANRSPLEKAARVGLLTARNVFYNPERYTRDEFNEHKKEVADAKEARRAKLAASAAAFKQSRADAKAKRDALYKERDAEKKRQQQAAKDAKNPTLASLLLSRLGMGPQPRAGSWKEQMKQRDLERRGNWYSWRRAFGRKDLRGDDVHKYSDRFGLFGGLMDTGSGMANSLVGSLAGSALGLVGRGVGATARFGGRTALRGIDAARAIGLRGAVKAGKGFLPMVGGGLKLAGGLMKGPLGIGLLAHEVDQGFAENTTGATRRVGTTLSKMAEYGAMGAFFGPWGIAIGAGVGALVANMDYVSKAVKGVGNAVGSVLSPLWTATKAVGRVAWDVTKFTGRAVKGAWTTIFGSSAKFDSHGRVIQQEKNSILGDFRTVLFGQKAKYSRDGQLISSSKRSMFGVIHDGFTKTFFGDKFSNGSYKPGTSLVDMAWNGMKRGIGATATFFKNLPGQMWGMMKKGATSMWGGVTNFLKKDLAFLKGVGSKIKGGYDKAKAGASWVMHKDIDMVKGIVGFARHLNPKDIGAAIRGAPKKITKAAKSLVRHAGDKLTKLKHQAADKLAFAAEHPFLAAGDAFVGTMGAIGHIPGASPVAGAAAASSKWILNSAEMMDASSPVRRYIRASLDLYGVDTNDLYEFIHQIETDEEKVAAGKLKQYNHDDLRWFAGKFGLDPKNDDSVNYFITWFNNRFLPMFKIVSMTLTKYKLTVTNVLNASNPVILAVAKDLEGAKKTIPASVTTLKPSLAAYKKLSDDSKKMATTLNATTIKNPDTGSSVNGLPNTTTTGAGANQNNSGNTKPQQTAADAGTGASPYTPDGVTATPNITPGNVTEQKEYKSAYALLAKNVRDMVDKDKSLQFTLWAECIQDGPQKTAHTFNTEYREGETAKNFRDDIYQDRGQHFTQNTGADKIAAMRQLAKEQDFAGTITDTSGQTLQQMGDAIGHPIMSLGNGTQPSLPNPTKPEQLKKAAEISKYIISKYHYSPQFAAAMAAQEVVESRMNPTAVGDGGSAYGAFQWHQDRQKKIFQHFKKPLQQMNLEEQTDAAIWELQSGADPQSARLLQQVGQATDTRTAVDAFVNQYERPLDRTGNVITRTAVANEIMKTLSAQPATDSTAGGNTISRGDQTREQMADGTGAGSAGSPVSPDGTPGQTAGGAGAGSSGGIPTVNANVDQSQLADKLDAIHDTLKKGQAGSGTPSGATMSASSSSGASPTAAPQPIVQQGHNISITNVSPQTPSSGNSHGSVVDMQMKKVAATAGVVQ